MIQSPSIVLLPNRFPKPSFCWNSSWVKEYESPWSILEKFKYANYISAKDVLLEFGATEVLKKKIINCNKTNGNLITLSGFDSEKLKTVLRIDLKEINYEYLNTIIDPLPRGRIAVIREKLTFCKTCIKYGFHSILHQFGIIQQCPYHCRKLEDRCPKCHRSVEYRFSDELRKPFECNCGYKFLKHTDNFSKNWTNFKPIMKNADVKRWISISVLKKEKRPELIVFDETDYEQHPNALQQILSFRS